MASEAPDQLVDRLHDRTGRNLRSVLYYEDGAYELAYVRTDVEHQYTDEEIERVVEEMTAEAAARPAAEWLFAHGELESIVRMFEDGVEVHIPLTETSGVAIGVDAEAFVLLQSFIVECYDAIAEGSPFYEGFDDPNPE